MTLKLDFRTDIEGLLSKVFSNQHEVMLVLRYNRIFRPTNPGSI